MKRLSVIALTFAAVVSVSAETSLKMLDFGSEEGPGKGEPGMLGLGISPDGQYVCGTLESGLGPFIGDLSTGKMWYELSDSDEGGQLRNINDQGVAIGFNGPGITISADGTQTLLEIPEGYREIIGEDISSGGTVMVGSLVGTGYVTSAAYSKDGGVWQHLPFPEVDMGEYGTKQSKAQFVSSDGSIILGSVGTLGPACLWRLNEAGEYVADPFFVEYANVYRDGDRPYITFSAAGLSANGKHVLLEVREKIGGSVGLTMPAIYDTETEELEVYSDIQAIDTYKMGLHPIAIADDGTFIGMVGQPASNYGSFIMKAGKKQAEMFTQAFPEYARVFEVLDLGGYHVPAAMSANGRYILGNGWYCADEDIQDPGAFFYFMTYVLDTGTTAGVNSMTPDGADALPSTFYTLDGKRIDAPSKGITIIRMTDGSSRKVMQ